MIRINNRFFIRILQGALLALCLFAQVYAQDTLPKFRPKIGLVLAGGGAKGLAHIGVIKVLEEAGFEVDIVGGTSMGSIIGGLYAMGYDAKTMQTQVADINWEVMMSQTPDPATQPLLSYQAEARYQLKLPLVGFKPMLPSGFNNGQKIYLMLTYLSENYHEVSDFSQLPRSFFCVACDFYSGEEVILDHGFLPDAMRASASIPSFFAPVPLNGRVLIDGGWVNNFPVERMKERGADFIIGVDFPQLVYSPDVQLSLLDVLVESGSYVNTRYNAANRALCDVLIIPELGDISSTDYYLADTIVKIGEHTARKQFERLKFLADSLGIVQRHLPNPLPQNDRQINLIRYEGVDSVLQISLNKTMNTAYQGPMSPDEYLTNLRNLYGTQDFEQVCYRICEDSCSASGHEFVLKLNPKNHANTLNASINYTTDFGASLLLNLTQRNLLYPGYRLVTDVIVSQSPSVKLTYHSAFGPELTPAAEVQFLSYRQPLYQEGVAISQYIFQNLTVKAFGLSNLNVNAVAGFGLAYHRTDLFGDAYKLLEQPKQGFNLINLNLFYRKNTFRDNYFATDGKRLTANIEASWNVNTGGLIGTTIFYDVQYTRGFQLSRHWATKFSVASSSSLNNPLEGANQIYIGGYGTSYSLGLHPFFGYRRMEIAADGLHTLSTQFDYNFAKNQYLKIIGNIGTMAQFKENGKSSYTYIDGFGGGYAYNSPIGPLQVMVAKSTQNSRLQFYLYLGLWF